MSHKNANQKSGFIAGFVITMLILFTFLTTIFLFTAVNENERISNTKLANVAAQINALLIPALEEEHLEIRNRIDALAKDIDKLKDNCTEIRYIISPKFGKSVLRPIQRITSPQSEPSDKVSFPKISILREK